MVMNTIIQVKQMKQLLFLFVIYLNLTKNDVDAIVKEVEEVNSSVQIEATQIISMRCVSTLIDIIHFNGIDLSYPQMCSYKRTYSQQLSYKFVLKNSRKPVLTLLRKMYVNETRSNGTLNIVSIGFIESGIKSLIGTTFVELLNYPNLKSGSCAYVEGIMRQVGTAEFILTQIEAKYLQQLFFKYTPDQIVAIFKKQEIAQCFANSRLRYRNAIMNEELIPLTSPDMNRGLSETTESYIENLAECEPLLSEPVLRITDKQQIKIKDSCDSVNLSDRYESGITRFNVYNTQNDFNSVSVKIIYKNANRNKGSFNETILGFVVKGPPNLMGTAYLRLAVVPNLNEHLCHSESGVKKLVGSAERVFANINLQNLISVMNIESLISRIRMNRIIDCLGFIMINYEPGLLFSNEIESVSGYPSNMTKSFLIVE